MWLSIQIKTQGAHGDTYFARKNKAFTMRSFYCQNTVLCLRSNLEFPRILRVSVRILCLFAFYIFMYILCLRLYFRVCLHSHLSRFKYALCFRARFVFQWSSFLSTPYISMRALYLHARHMFQYVPFVTAHTLYLCVSLEFTSTHCVLIMMHLNTVKPAG